jgi:dienelactone hydrolase
MKYLLILSLAFALVWAVGCESTPKKNGSGSADTGTGDTATSTAAPRSDTGTATKTTEAPDPEAQDEAPDTTGSDTADVDTTKPDEQQTTRQRGTRNVTITTDDDVTIHGTLYLPSGDIKGGVVCLPMYRRTRETFKPAADLLVKQGIAVLAIDPRGHGDSGTEEHALLVSERDTEVFRAMTGDVEAAVKALRERHGVGDRPIGILGASAGAAVAVLFAAGRDDIAALALLSPGDYLGLEASRSAGDVNARVLITTEDTTTADPIYTALFGSGAGIPEYHQDSLKDARQRITHHGTDQLNKEYGIEEKLAEYFTRNLR